METDLATQQHSIERAAERLYDEFPLQLCVQRDDGNEIYTQEPILPVALIRPEPLSVIGASRREKQSRLVDFILKESAGSFGLNTAELLSKSRLQHRVRARQTAAYIIRESMGLSYPSIAQLMGGRDHTTVINSVKKVKDAIETQKTTFDYGFIQRTIEMVRTASINNPEADESLELESMELASAINHQLIFVGQAGLAAAGLSSVDKPIADHFNTSLPAFVLDLDTQITEIGLYEKWGNKAADLLRRMDQIEPFQAS